MSTINNVEPAFPAAGMTGRGMSLRDYFAGQALAALMAGTDHDARRFLEQHQSPADAMANACFTMADAMLKARRP